MKCAKCMHDKQGCTLAPRSAGRPTTRKRSCQDLGTESRSSDSEAEVKVERAAGKSVLIVEFSF